MACLGERSGKTSDDNVTYKHDGARGEEQRPTADFVDGGSSSNGKEQVPDLETSRDQSLIRDAGDTNCFEDQREVVAHDAVTAPLGKDAQGDGNEEAAAVTLRLDHVHVACGGVSVLFCSDGGLNLDHLEGDEGAVEIATCVGVCDDLFRFVRTAASDEPSGAFGCEKETGECDGGEAGL
jgi:hypothetical protein